MATATQSFDKQILAKVREELQKAIDSALEPFGLKGSLGCLSYTPTQAQCRITMLAGLSDGDLTVNPRELPFRLGWQKLSAAYDLKEELLDQEIVGPTGTRYVIVGLNARNRKYPVILREKGKADSYIKVTPDWVKTKI